MMGNEELMSCIEQAMIWTHRMFDHNTAAIWHLYPFCAMCVEYYVRLVLRAISQHHASVRILSAPISRLKLYPSSLGKSA